MLRIISNLVIFISIFILPTYISILLVFSASIIFSNFAESIFWGYLLDKLYGNGNIFGFSFSYFFTLSSFVFYIASFKLKKIIRVSF